MNPRTAAIIVLFNPDDQVDRAIKSLANSAALVVVVVNAASNEILSRIKLVKNVELICNSSNLGLASAFNAGMKFAFDEKYFDYVILLDQDSRPPDNLINNLEAEFIDSGQLNLACIAPQLVDLKAAGSSYYYNNAQSDIVVPRSMPTSGTLISRRAYLEIGSMKSDLFIDGIDHEWCFRAYSKGFVVKVSDKVVMLHNMGDEGLNFLGNYKPIHRSPLRHYFIIRNAIYLSSLSYIPLTWRLMELLKTVRRIFVYTMTSSDRLETIKLIAKAILDGVLKRLGPLSISDK